MPCLLPFRALTFPDPKRTDFAYIPGEEPRPPVFAENLRAMQEDAAPALWIYRQRFTLPGGQEGLREGAMGVLADTRNIHIHEEVLPAAVEMCREELLSTGACLSSLFLWTRDHASELARCLRPCAPPHVEYPDQFGCLHQYWRMAEPGRIAAVQNALAGQPLFLADGHHRFAAGWPFATIQVRTPALLTAAPHRPGGRAVPLDALEQNALRGFLLPPKSTDFFPKLAAGLVVYRHQKLNVNPPTAQMPGVRNPSS